jgi:hypothetical protein
VIEYEPVAALADAVVVRDDVKVGLPVLGLNESVTPLAGFVEERESAIVSVEQPCCKLTWTRIDAELPWVTVSVLLLGLTVNTGEYGHWLPW